MNRDEHMQWCKKRALEYLDQGDTKNAITSMLSDLSKHEETRGIGEKMGTFGILFGTKSPADARKFIEGFN